jgi:hypothetical protein
VICLCEVVLVVDAHPVSRDGALEEGEVVRLARDLLHQASPQEAHQIKVLAELKEQGIELVDMTEGSVRLYFWCRTRQALLCLLEWFDNGRLQNVVKNLINFLLKTDDKVSVKLTRSHQDYDRCMKYFTNNTGRLTLISSS